MRRHALNGTDAYAVCAQGGFDFVGEVQGVCTVAVQAEAVGEHRDGSAADGVDAAVDHQLLAVGDGFVVGLHLRVRPAARHQRAVGQVAAVGEHFGNYAQTAFDTGLKQQAA